MTITIQLRDGRTLDVEAEGKAVAMLADIGAAQTDEHREGPWTLRVDGRAVDPDLSAEEAELTDGMTVDVVLWDANPSLLTRIKRGLGI